VHEQKNAMIEFWFDIASNYSYLSAMRIETLAAQRGVALVWRPFLLGPILKDNGWDNSPFVLHRARGDYAWKDMARQAARYGLPWRRPTVFPRNSVTAVRVAHLLAGTPAIGDFVRACMHRNFVLDEDIGHPATVADILDGLGLDGPAVLDAAALDDNRAAVRHQIGQARAAGIFGAPSFLVDGELFWGNDRLDEAIDHACGRPGNAAPCGSAPAAPAAHPPTPPGGP
jgi:2-hydroxychromene-2-carboxylate isomerase